MVLKEILKTKFLKVYEYVGWTFVSRKDIPVVFGNTAPDAVCVMALHTRTMKLVVIKQYRKSIANWMYECPAGLIDKGESIQEAAIRELKEETGLDTIAVQTIIPRTHASIGLTDEIQAIVFLTCDGEPTTKYNEGDEQIEILMLDKQEVIDLVMSGMPVDSRLALASAWFPQ
jgi:ADP-ribose pyrophosphatase